MIKKNFVVTSAAGAILLMALNLTGCECVGGQMPPPPPAPNMKEDGGLCSSNPYSKSPKCHHYHHADKVQM